MGQPVVHDTKTSSSIARIAKGSQISPCLFKYPGQPTVWLQNHFLKVWTVYDNALPLIFCWGIPSPLLLLMSHTWHNSSGNLYFRFRYLSNKDLLLYFQGGRGHLAVHYTSLQSFIITFSYLLALQFWGLLLNFDWFMN